MKVVVFHWLLQRGKYFNTVLGVFRNLCYLCSHHKIYHDYHDTCLSREREVTASFVLGEFQANMQKGQELTINIGVTDKKRCD